MAGEAGDEVVVDPAGFRFPDAVDDNDADPFPLRGRVVRTRLIRSWIETFRHSHATPYATTACARAGPETLPGAQLIPIMPHVAGE
jgi:hypothetical protein